MDSEFFSLDTQSHPSVLMLQGQWTVQKAGELTNALKPLKNKLPDNVQINPSKLDKLDTEGAWILINWMDSLKKNIQINEADFQPKQALIYKRVLAVGKIVIPLPPAKPPLFIGIINHIGQGTISIIQQLYLLCCFMGQSSVAFIKTVFHPKTWRLPELARHIEETGFNAIPIIAMMGFLISVVLAYQGAFQLRKFGAEIFTVDLVAISVLREMGVLITAIMVAGRSGSAFAAEIGVMKVNEEIDALRTLGLSPITILVLPRMMALIITLPLLTFLSDIMGLLGGAILMHFSMDLTFSQYASRVHEAIVFSTFAVGMLKAPVFAAIIALVGCLRGMQVTTSAESVGQMTTKAVVESIVLVIIFDALFSILFTKLNI
jgi:phospholipid/cholesterol/gamma-HCH transport system permease protein